MVVEHHEGELQRLQSLAVAAILQGLGTGTQGCLVPGDPDALDAQAVRGALADLKALEA